MMTKSLEKQQEKSKLSKFNCHCSSCCGFGLIKSSFSESSVHGCNHIVNPIYHIIERFILLNYHSLLSYKFSLLTSGRDNAVVEQLFNLINSYIHFRYHFLVCSFRSFK